MGEGGSAKGAAMKFTEEQRDALTGMLLASQRAAEVFDEMSPWGLASRRIARSAGRALRAEQAEQPRPDLAAGHTPHR